MCSVVQGFQPVADTTSNVPVEGLLDCLTPNVGAHISVNQLALRLSVLRDLIDILRFFRNINSNAMRSEVARHVFSVEIKRSRCLPGSKGRGQLPGWAP